MCAVALALAFASPAGASSKIDDARKLRNEGKLEAAHDLMTAAAAEYRAAGDSRNLARAREIAADLSVSEGRYQQAIAEAAEAVDLRTKLHDAASLGDDYNTLGLARQYLGDYPAALARYRQALDADRAAGDAEGEVTRLNNIGNIFYFLGRYSDALRSYQDALRKTDASAAAPWNAAKRQLTIANLAALFQRLGQEQRALDYYRRLADSPAWKATPLAPNTQPMPPGERGQLLLNQGVLYRRLGDPVKALELYRAAQALFAEDRHPDAEIGALRNVGIVLAIDLNDPARALESFTQALDLARRSSDRRGAVQAALYRGELLHRAHRIPEAQADLDDALSGARAAGLVEEQWKALHALGRIAQEAGRTADAERDYRDAIAIIESVRAGLRLTPLRSDFLADKRDVYDSLIDLRLRDPNATPAEIFSWMERSRARTLLDRLRGRVALAEPRLAAIQAALRAGAVMVEFWLGAESGAALWMTANNSGLVRYPDAAALRAEAAAASSGAPLTDRILPGIPLAERLIIVPDGSLSALPFETLPVPQTGRPLIEQCEVSYLPSARFVGAAPRRNWRPPWATELVALADPLVESDPFDDRWERLPGSADEARAIARILPGRVRLHLGADMLKRYLLDIASGGAPLVHIASHALIDAENPDRSRILLAHDALLQEEVYDLDWTGVDLVTLSACDTARGKFVRGENQQAFSQAFLAAGAGAVVTTLWRVADRPTADFMKQFYYGLARGESKAGALRTAKLSFLHSASSLAEPRYWAAFVLTGDGGSSIPRAVPWSVCFIAAAVALATLVAAAAVFRARPLRQKA